MAMENYIRIARLYWKYHRRWYTTHSRRWRLPSGVGKRHNTQVHRLMLDLDVLPSLIEALVSTAPAAKDLPLLGIDVIQEAYHVHGDAAFAALDRARLLAEHRRLILSGVWPSTLRQAGVRLGGPEE